LDFIFEHFIFFQVSLALSHIFSFFLGGEEGYCNLWILFEGGMEKGLGGAGEDGRFLDCWIGINE
jgi:hypothetical protein